MGSKRRSNRRKQSSDEDDDDDDDDDSDSEESEDSEIQQRQQQKRSTLRQQSRKQTYGNQNNNGEQVKKKVQIVVDNNQDDDFNMNKKRSQYRKPTSVNRLRKTQDEDEKDEDHYIMTDLNQEDNDEFQSRKRSDGRKKSPNKTIINSKNLAELKTKANQLDQQNLKIENLEYELVKKQQQVLTLNLEQKQDIEEKEKDIQNLNTQKSLLERKVGRQKTYLKKIKEQLNFRKGSLLNLQLERRNSEEDEMNNSTNNHDIINLPIEIQHRMLKKTSLFNKIVNFLQYNYPLSKIVHRILNFYTKNEELHFTYIAVNFNLSMIFFFLFLPFIILQILSNISHFNSSKPLSFVMYHEYQSQNLTALIIIFCSFILISAVVLFYRVSYMRKKDVESEAQSLKDLNNFKLVFSSLNYRLSNYGNKLFTDYIFLMIFNPYGICKCQPATLKKISFYLNLLKMYLIKKQQIALKNRVLLSWKLTDKYILRRKDYGNWIYVLRISSVLVQIALLVGTLYLLQYLNKLNFFSNQILLKMPLAFSFACVFISNVASQISYSLTQIELWSTYSYSYLLRIWKSFLIQTIVMFYACLLKSPLQFNGQDLTFIGLQNNFNYLYTQFDCASEQLVYSLISLYIAQFFWSLLTMIFPNLIQLIFKSKMNKQMQKIMKKSTPFRVLEDTYPIIILNMIGNMIVPIFPLICIINAVLHLIIFAFNWQIIIRFKFQNYSSVSRQFIMKTLVKFYVAGNILSLIYYAIMCYQVQGDYFMGDEYQKNKIQRICGPLNFNTTIVGSISEKISQITYVNYLFELLSWVPLLWVLVIFLFGLQRLESKTKNVWRNEYFIKSREMETIKNYFQQRAKSYENKINFAQSELQNLDTPKHDKNGTPSFFDYTPANAGKSKFSVENKSFSINSPVNSNTGLIGNIGLINDFPSSQGMDDSKQSFVSRNNSVGNNFKILLSNNNNNFSKFKPF